MALFLALGLGMPGGLLAASHLPTHLQQACAAAPAPPVGGEQDIVLRRMSDEPGAWGLACAVRPLGAEATLRVLEALMPSAPAGELQKLLDELDSQSPVPARLRGRVLLARAELLLRQGQNAAFLPVAMQALSELGHSPEGAAVVVRLRLVHQVWRLDGKAARDQVLAWLDEARQLLEMHGRTESVAYVDVDRLLGVTVNNLGDSKASLVLIDRQLERLQRIGQGHSGRMVFAWGLRANVLLHMGRLDEALAAAGQGAEIVARHPEQPSYAVVQLAEAHHLVLLRMGRPAEALVHVERGLANARQFQTEGSVVFVQLLYRAEVLMALRRWQDAYKSIEEAQTIGRRSAANFGPWRMALVELLHAQVLDHLGEPDAAQAAIDRGLAIFSSQAAAFGDMHRRLWTQKAAMASRQGDWVASDYAYLQALLLLTPQAEAAVRLPLEVGRCQAQRQGLLPGEACQRLRDYRAQADSMPGYLRFQLFNALAESATGPAAYEDALLDHLRALDAAQAVGGPDPMWAALDALARHWRRLGQRELAIVAAKRGVLEIESMRTDEQAELQRLQRGFLSDKLVVYRRLADWLAEDGRLAEALQVLRLQQGEEFSDFVRRDAGLTARRSPVTTAELLSDAELRLWRGWHGVDAAAPAQGLLHEQRVRAWWEALQRQPHQASPGRPGPVGAPWVWSAASAPPPPGVLRVTMFPGDRHLHVILADATDQEALLLPMTAPVLSQRVGRLLAALGRKAPLAELTPMLRAWHTELAAPVLAAARRRGAQQLQLQPFGALRYLPLAALDGGEGSLAGHITLVQHVDDVEPVDAQSRPSDAALQVLAVTRAQAGLPALPALDQEVCDIVRGPVQGGSTACTGGALPGRAWLNESFTRERLAAAARSGGNRLHVGSHFVLRPGHMGRSWLLLGDGDRITLEDLAKLDFSTQELVTLSACETGLGGAESQGEEVHGLNRLVIHRGAKAVLASLWRVEDGSTAALMASFYRALASGMAAPRALRQAQADMRAHPRWSHAYHWAGFYLASR